MWRAALTLVLSAGCVDIAGLNELEFAGAGGASSVASASTGAGGATSAGGGTPCPADMGDCDGVASNGCEELLVDNDAHCGTCGHTCAPSSCAGRRCESAVLITGEGAPHGVRAAAGRLYWVASLDGSIRRCDAGDCAGTVITIANSGATAYFMALDATHVYWNRNSADEMWRCPVEGCLGNEQLLASAVNAPTTSAVGGGYLYWASNEGTVRRVAVGGGQPELMATAEGSDGWVDVDGTHLYWTTRTGGTVNRCDVAQCQTTKVAVASNVPNACGIDIDADSIYVSTSGNATDQILKLPKAGGGGVQLATGLREVWSVLELGDHLYWVEKLGNVARAVSKDGGNIIELAGGLSDPWTLTHDGGFIYIADKGNGRILRVDPL